MNEMNISFKQGSLPAITPQKPPLNTPFKAQQSFATVLKESLDKVNEAQIVSDEFTVKMAKGENVDLHEVMIASQKASVTLQLTLEMRNKAVEAYQEMMRMNI